MSDVPDPTDQAARDRKPEASWLRIWWPALLIAGTTLLVSGWIWHIQSTKRSLEISRYNARALVLALERFENEYGNLPDVSALNVETDTPESSALIGILMGKEDPDLPLQNARQIPFLSSPFGKKEEWVGLEYSRENLSYSLLDGWKRPFRVVLRSDEQSALVISRGRDGELGTRDDMTFSILPKNRR